MADRIVYYDTKMAPTPRKRRWNLAEAQIALLRKAEEEAALRKSRYSHAFTRVDEAMRSGKACASGGAPIPIPGMDAGPGRPPEARGSRPWPAGEEPMPVLSHGDEVHFQHSDGKLYHGVIRGLSRSGTHALVETRAGKFTVPAARLTPGRLRVNTESVEKSLHQRFEHQGIPVSVEHRAGSMRRWRSPETDAEGFTRMRHRYGYIPGTSGMDGEPVDVMVGPWPDAPEAHVVKQLGRSGGVEELKVMLGFRSAAEAREAYLQHWPADIFGGIESMPVETLRRQVTR